MLAQTPGASVPATKEGKMFASIYVRKMFYRCSPNTCWSQSSRFVCVVTHKSLVYSAPIVNEETRHELIFYAFQTIRNNP
jgi:hypothetical protein